MSRMTKNDAAYKLYHTITDILAEHPDLAGEAAMAIGAGVRMANEKMQKDLADVRVALSLSLALLPPNRLTEGGRDLLELCVSRALPLGNLTPAEKIFVSNVKAKIEGAA